MRHMIAGSFAGAAEHVLCYPIDTIKTHMQAAQGIKASFKETASFIVQLEGGWRLWNGAR